jgi:hypothetical protein
MSIKIEIKSADVDVRNGTSQRTGKPYSIREQVGWGYFVDPKGALYPYPQRVRLTLDEGEEPYKPGTYQLAAASFYPDRFDQIVCRAKLQPIAAAASSRAAA